MPGGKPVADVAALLDLWPVLGELEDAHALGDAEREPASRLLVRVTGWIMVAENYEVGAAQLLAMLDLPFGFFVRLARALHIARGGDTDRPQGVSVCFALNTRNGVSERDGFLDFVLAIEHAGVSTAGAPFPLAAIEAVTDAETRLMAFRIANLLKPRIVIGRHKAVAATVALASCAVALGAALLWSAPSAMVAMPRRAGGIDL